MIIYLAGPMRGIPHYNFAAFDAEAHRLRSEGHFVHNPADIDRKHGYDALTMPADTDWDQMPPGLNLRKVIARDIEAILASDAIYMLKGWSTSKGAYAELQLARWAGLEEMYQK